MPVTLIGNLFGCIPLASVVWGSESLLKILSWVGAIYLLTFFRWLHLRSFDAVNASVEQILTQGKGYTIAALFAGLIWGSAPLLFFQPESLEIFTAILLTLIVVIGASMIALSSRPITHAAFAFPALLPIVITMFMQDSLLYRWSGFGILTYLAVSCVFSRNVHRVISNSLDLKYQNIDLVSDLKKQTEAANKANVDKSRFLAAASHDLRQPLHAVNLFVETLDKKITSDSQKNDLTHIRHGLDSLAELFDALLDITRMDSNALLINKSHFSLADFMSKWLDQYSQQATSKHLTLTVKDCHHFVYTDPILLEQVIRNLLSNAIRYTEKGHVDIYCTDENDEQIRLHIRDTGLGIADVNQEDIFNEFHQLNNPERDRNKGLGLGLAIVKRIAKKLDYQLTFASKLGTGTEFALVLPKGEKIERSTIKHTKSVAKNKLNNVNVMLIDNESQILLAMENILDSWGCKPTNADSVEKALKLIKNGYQPDIILTDYRMPGDINGSKLITLIQQQVGDIPGIVVTGDTGNDVIAEIAAANQVRLSKPVKPAQLRIAMSHLIH
jgi:signal transduction histidine kinase